MRALTATLSGAALLASLTFPTTTSASVPSSELDAARDGLAAWLKANKPATPSTSTNIPGCPAIELPRVHEALAGIGLDVEFGDWATEIEWGEYEDIDPNLMGIVCGGDADGDANDGDYELALNVFAVDAGTDERALEVIQGFGFGALDVVDAEVPGVDGGELTTGCLDDGGLSACLTFWSKDGMIVGATLQSDTQKLPDEASQTVLTDLLPDALTTLAAHVDATAPETPISAPEGSVAAGDRTPVGAARAGLDRILSGTADTDPDEPLGQCGLADVRAVDTALQTAGVDAPLSDWGQWVAPITAAAKWPQRAIVCQGVYVSAQGDPSFPDVDFALAVVDFGDQATLDSYLAEYADVPAEEAPMPTPQAGAATRGVCVQRDRVYDCYEAWTDGSGFAVLIHVKDQVFFDRPTASAVLNELVPGVLASLGGRATDAGDPLTGVPDGDVDAALAGLAQFVENAGSSSSLECPAASESAVGEALSDAGVDAAFSRWFGRFHHLPAESGGEEPLRLVCTDFESLVTLDVIDFYDDVAASEFVASLALSEGGTPADLPPGSIVNGDCTTVDGHQFCNALWQNRQLVVGVTLSGDADAIAEDDAGEMLVVLVPQILENLGALAG